MIHGDYGKNIGMDVEQTPTGEFVIAGTARVTQDDPLNGDVWLVKLDANGNEMWTSYFGGAGGEEGRGMAPAHDGGWVVCGMTYSFGDPDVDDMYCVKADADGNLEWVRTFGGDYSDAGRDVIATNDGGYLWVGYTRSFGATQQDILLVKTDADGNEQWHQLYGGSENDQGWSLAQLENGNYAIAGRTWSYGAGGRDAILMEVTPTGEQLWQQTYGGPEKDHFYEMRPTPDGGFINTGKTESFGQGAGDAWLIKTDAVGDEEWRRFWGTEELEFGRSCTPTTDGGYAFCGVTHVDGNVGNQLLVAKASADGEWEWSFTIGGSDMEDSWCIRQTQDYGYVVSGFSWSYGNAERSMFVVRLESDYGEVSANLSAPTEPVAVTPESTFSYTWAVHNNTYDQITGYDLWQVLEYPSGVHGPPEFMYSDNLELEPLTEIGQDLLYEVGNWVLGTYSLHLQAGHYPNVVDSDELQFIVSESGTGTDPEVLIPETFALSKVYPNPFNSTLTIAVDVAQPTQLTVKLFDVSGRLVKTLVRAPVAPGQHQYSARMDDVASGMYFLLAENSLGESATEKVVLLR